MVDRDINASLLAVVADPIDIVRDPTAVAAPDFPIGARLGERALDLDRIEHLRMPAFVSLHLRGAGSPALPLLAPALLVPPLRVLMLIVSGSLLLHRLVNLLLLGLLVHLVLLLRPADARLLGFDPD
jgi:hypothetical protein